MKELIFLNGKFVDKKDAVISAFSEGALYGWGVFETMRAFGGRIVYYDAHLERLKSSAKSLHINIGYTADKLKSIIKEMLKSCALKDACIRLTIWKNSLTKTDVMVSVREYKAIRESKYKEGFACKVADFRHNQGSLLSRHKTANYLACQLAYSEAESNGFDEAIMLNNSGYVAEASRANLFMAKDNMLFTPALECGCLDGITRRVVLDIAKKDKIEAKEGNFTLQDVYNSHEVFLTNSLIGIMPVKSVEGIAIKKASSKDSLTESFMKKYRAMLYYGK